MGDLLIFTLLSVGSTLVSGGCPGECDCPPGPTHCPPGVTLLLHRCPCCKVCAKQLNEDCSPAAPCDQLKGLECNRGARPDRTSGICRAKSEGRTCEYNGRIYQNSEIFQPSCKHQCTCIDGAVGCIPLCPQVASKYRGVTFYDLTELAAISSNELIRRKHHSLNNLAAWRPLFEGRRFPKIKCIVQTTQWSKCSKTCGMGVSTRVTNDNPDCKLTKETRLCQTRPCSQTVYPKLKRGKKCTTTQKAKEPIRFTYAGCKSVKKYRPNSCGLCIDQRCCSPLKTRTIRVQFYCEDGETFNKKMMMIQSCKCSSNCPHLNEVAQPYFRLYNDIHKFLE